MIIKEMNERLEMLLGEDLSRRHIGYLQRARPLSFWPLRDNGECGACRDRGLT